MCTIWWEIILSLLQLGLIWLLVEQVSKLPIALFRYTKFEVIFDYIAIQIPIKDKSQTVGLSKIEMWHSGGLSQQLVLCMYESNLFVLHELFALLKVWVDRREWNCDSPAVFSQSAWWN